MATAKFSRSKEQREIIKKEALPLKNAMLKTLNALLPMDEIRPKERGEHLLIWSIIERAIADAQTEMTAIGGHGQAKVDYQEIVDFLTNKNKMLELYLECTAWNQDNIDRLMEYLKEYARKMQEIRERVLKAGEKKKKYKIIIKKLQSITQPSIFHNPEPAKI